MIGASMGYRPDPARRHLTTLELVFWILFIATGSAGLTLVEILWLVKLIPHH